MAKFLYAARQGHGSKWPLYPASFSNPIWVPNQVPSGLQFHQMLRFGKCEVNSLYTAERLWCINFPGFDWTYLVPEDVVTPETLKHYTSKDWEQAALKVITGNWCMTYECLWYERPVYQYEYSPRQGQEFGLILKYGLAKTQFEDYQRPLWFVAFPTGAVFIVDEVCTSGEFLSRMPPDPDYWRLICWQWETQEPLDKLGTPEDRFLGTRGDVKLDPRVERPFEIPYDPRDWLRILPRVVNYKWGSNWSSEFVKGHW